MTKQQKLGVGFGGAFGVIALVLGWFLYSAYADCQAAQEGDPDSEENTQGLNDAQAANMKYYSQSNPFPSESAIATVNANRTAYTNWMDRAKEQASKGDLPEAPSGLSGNAFKGNYLDVGLTKLRQLPNAKGAPICTGDKWFGFERYMGSEGATPKQDEVPKLYKQFVTVTNLVDIFVKTGVSQIVSIDLNNEKNDNAASTARGASQNGQGQAANAGNGAAVANTPVRYDYDLVFHARPAAIVGVLNALANSPRFYVVNEFGFKHAESESLKNRLERMTSGGGESQSRRGRRNREKQEGEEIKGFVTDLPENAPPLLVSMKLSVYDFGTGGVTNAVVSGSSPENATEGE